MKANELRIGNYFTDCDSNEPRQVRVVLHKENGYNIIIGNDYSHVSNLEPIPLTEEWLLKFGFVNLIDKEDIKSLDLFINKGVIGFYANNEDNYNSVYVYSETYNDKDQVRICDNITYVHQLQNLYFALTQKELTIK